MTAELTPGGEYFAVASGTFKVGGQSSHIADAEWHKHPSKGWKDLTTLTGHNTDMGLDDASGRLGHWDGDLSTPSIHERATDAVYGQYFTADSSDPLALFYRDVEGQGPNGPGSTWYDDNSGSLTVKLYQEVELETLTAVDPNDSSTQPSVDDGTTPAETLVVSANAEGYYEVEFYAGISVAASGADAAKAMTLWELRDDTGAVVSFNGVEQKGNFTGGSSITVQFHVFTTVNPTVFAWVDSIPDDLFGATESSRRIPLQALDPLQLAKNQVTLDAANPTDTVQIGPPRLSVPNVKEIKPLTPGASSTDISVVINRIGEPDTHAAVSSNVPFGNVPPRRYQVILEDTADTYGDNSFVVVVK